MTNEPRPRPDPTDQDEPPPILGSWRNVYALLIAQLGVTIVVFYAIARWAS